MELALLFYFAGVSGNIGAFLIIISTLVLIVSFIGMIVHLVAAAHKDEDTCNALRKFKFIPILALIGAVIAIALPQKETIYTMAAAYGVQSVAENPDVKRVAGKSLELIERTIDEYTKKPAKE